MTELQDAATSDETATPVDIHYQTVSQRVPQWLVDAPAHERKALRAVQPAPIPWLANASVNLPEALRSLRDEHQRHQQLGAVVDGFLGQLPSAEAFAEPLLRDALKSTFGMDLDVHHTFLFNAVRARAGEAHINNGDPVVRAFQVVKAATQSLLQAALQNFEAYEAAPDGMQDDRRPSQIFLSESGSAAQPGLNLNLVPERFAALCRELDLGGRYQRLIDATFKPKPLPEQSAEAAASARQAWFKLFDQSVFRLNLHLAWLQSWIGQDMYDDLLALADNGKTGATLERAVLRLWDVELNGIVLFLRSHPATSTLERLVVYMPDEPRQPFQEFHSIRDFHLSLRDRLQQPAWQRYFLRFVPARQRERVLQRIQRTLYPKVWNEGGWYEERLDPNAVLRLGKREFSTPLFDTLLQRRIQVLKDDGLFHAVPTADEDHKSALDKLEYFASVTLNVLNVAAFVVPGLGQVMLVVNAAMLGYEVYEGFDSLARDEREQAWGYFLDVAENLAIMAAMGAAGAAAHRFTGKLPVSLRSMRPVTLADGSVRLWKPDLTPFAYDIDLPAGLQPGENGLYSHGGRHWLKLEGRYYSVRTLMGGESSHVLEHPERPWAYEPTLRHNGNGGWLHEADTPEQWRGMELFARQGHREAGISEAMALRALRISGVSEAELRHTLVNSRRPPALLTDTLRRLVLADSLGQSGALEAEAFAVAYEARQPRLADQGQLLKRQFGGLPNLVIEEILASANGDELAEMTRAGRVPLRLAEEARVYLQQVRIARACEGLYLDSEANLDSARLLLHGMQGLPGWPAGELVGLFEGAPAGRLLAGSEHGVAVAWKGQAPQAFCQALLDALPSTTRSQLEVTDGAELLGKLREQPLPARRQLREWLGMQPLKPAFRSPMRLADGRLGYPLSGRGNPFFTEDELLDKLRMLELDDLQVEDVLQGLYRSGLDRMAINLRLDQALDELLQLRMRLDRWTLESSRENLSEARQRSRERIGAALWHYWRRNLLPELGREPQALVFSQVQLADMPVRLPAFLRQQVRTLLLDEVMLIEGTDYQRRISEPAVLALAEEFPFLTSLDIRGGEWGTGLAQTISNAWPRLTSLGLREQAWPIGHHDLSALSGLPSLRWLELRGSRLHTMPVTALNGLHLDYLGLDWLGLSVWPHWLDNLALDRIGELSLVGNNLSDVPLHILDDPLPEGGRPMRMALQGNQFTYQALLDLRLSERFRGRYAFDLELSPALDDDLEQRVQERVRLHGALQQWIQPEEGAAPLAPEHSAYRQRIAAALLDYWRTTLRITGASRLHLEDVVLADFPYGLPEWFRTRIHRLELTRFDAELPTLERFVTQFPRLVEVSLTGGLPGLTQVPAFLGELAQLRDLSLVRMGMTIDQAAMEAFARLPLLSSLQLDGNVLGQINDMSMFNQHFLGFLGLSRMGITTWPAWLEQMLPNGIELLGLDDNQISELPEFVLSNHRTPTGAVEISLHGNPLTRETMIRAHTSQHFGRPYTFTMDVPADIAAMAHEGHSSDSDIADSVGTEDDWVSDEDPAATWETGDAEQDAQHEVLWAGLSARPEAQALMAMVARLRHSADYRASSTRLELVNRVWVVLEAAAQDAELCQILNGMAEEPVEQVQNHDTCPDGIRLEFNQMELLVNTRQALREIPEENRGPALFRLMRGLFRAQRLDGIARENASGRDEAEVRLAYRLRWAQQLDLPLPPRSMLFRRVANIAPGELDRAFTRLQLEEAGQELLTFAANCDFWSAYLREAYAERFKAIKDGYEAAVIGTIDTYPDDTPEQSAARIRGLEEQFRKDEQTLLEHLTLERSMVEG
ncbi:NEL-type E3 ubiquitin ligase domain-containing protein [Pseudomonas sp. 148P]|uniref:RING-type E3 ubiquitin transferase n=1 Tax=Pseudomonas ulcerans TaxID=3115852 RepID=A0ABU7HS50_9PSED|nr:MULTISPECIES: NEL-type E3 ubiquitin ligase domain-containing protein [unclassified Pseudomonas]MEE1923399.1 NEL-type E3 ubiquitin ligase domain-containing protein [Pseudomonas sp. 147P]MEE1934371.1 NEL-type E3 ubiquitin ligase domain-containing protein [Pseudomonas sp. 148P]